MSNLSTLPITALTGPPFIVVVVDWALFGILSIQVYIYFQVFKKDKLVLKALVYAVYVLALAETLLQTQNSWRTLVSGFGNVDGTDKIGTGWLSFGVFGGAVAFLVQWFYAFRIAVFSGSKIIPAVIILMSTTAYAAGMAGEIISGYAGRFSAQDLPAYRTPLFSIAGLWGVAISICDITIIISMWYYLGKRKTEAFPKTQAFLSKVIWMTIETGALTSSVSIVSFILIILPTFRDASYYKIPLQTVAGLYAVTMLALLNSRVKLGVVSESTTWHNNELVFDISQAREANTVEVNISSKDCATQTTLDACETREQLKTPTDNAKINGLV